MLTQVIEHLKGKVPLGTKRSAEWPKTRAEHLVKFPTCAACGGSRKLEVHHVKPFHIYPLLELDQSNLITLCESGRLGVNCHLAWGHLGNFKRENATCRIDAGAWLAKLMRAL